MGFCAGCNRVLLDEHIKAGGPLCPECKELAKAEKPKEPVRPPEKVEDKK